MKTLLITLEYPPQHGGVGNYYQNIVKNWPKDKIKVLNNTGNKLEASFLPAIKWGPAIISIFFKTLLGNYKHLIVGQILPLGIVIMPIAKLLNREYSVVLHGMDYSLAMSHPRKEKIATKILANAKNIICTNSYTAHLVRTKFDELNENIFVVHPGINPGERLRFRTQEEDIKEKYALDTKNILFGLGRLVERKGFDKVIEAMPDLVGQMSNLHFFLGGSGPDEERLKKLANSLDEETKKNIHFLGAIPNEEKWAWLNLAQLFIMPSRDLKDDYEGFGIVYLEANLAGKAVVAGRSGGVEDAVIDDETGILCDPENTEDIAGAVMELMVNKNKRKELANYGRERAIEEFNWEKQARLFWSIYSKD